MTGPRYVPYPILAHLNEVKICVGGAVPGSGTGLHGQQKQIETEVSNDFKL